MSKLPKHLRAKSGGARRKALFVKHFHSDERVAFMRGQPCEVMKVASDTVCNAHMRSRGSGGTYRDVVPLCFEAHKDLDELASDKFAQRYGRSKQSVRDCAPYYQQLWEEHHGGS